MSEDATVPEETGLSDQEPASATTVASLFQQRLAALDAHGATVDVLAGGSGVVVRAFGLAEKGAAEASDEAAAEVAAALAEVLPEGWTEQRADRYADFTSFVLVYAAASPPD
ncbi:MAG TPA: hypothetical protein VD962_08055 [Rubricoccaceae bacterium]|nr:hypothetical protein [Rubricoccaceae bacterium]